MSTGLSKNNILPQICAFAIIWQFFWSDNSNLRLYPYVFWPLLAGIALYNWNKLFYGKNSQKYGKLTFYALAYMTISSIFSIAFTDGLLFVAECMLYLLAVDYVIESSVSTEYLIKTIKAIALVHAGLVLLQYFIPMVFYAIVGAISGSEVVSELMYNASMGCYFGYTGQSSTISVYLIVGMTFTLTSLAKKFSLFDLIGLLTCLIAIPLTNRRGTFICTAVLLLIFLLFSKQSKSIKYGGVFIGVLVILAVGVENLPGMNALFEKVDNYNNRADVLSGRSALWEVAYDIFLNNPIFGAGQSSFVTLSKTDLPTAHNSYMQKLSELGSVGTIVFFLPYLNCLIKCIRQMRNKLLEDKNSFVSYIMLQMYFLVASFSEGIFETPCLFVIIYLVQLTSLSDIDKSVYQPLTKK